jgi:hypothetical protein
VINRLSQTPYVREVAGTQRYNVESDTSDLSKLFATRVAMRRLSQIAFLEPEP